MSSPEITNKKGMPLGRFLRFEAKKNPPKLYLFRWDYVSKTTKVDTMKRGREGVPIYIAIGLTTNLAKSFVLIICHS